MAKKRVPLHQNPRGFVDVDPDATNGAQVGVNLLGPDGQILTAAQVINPTTGGSGGPGSIASTIWKLIKEIPLNIQKLAALIGAGFAVRKNDGEWALRTLQEGTGIDIGNPDGDAGNPTIGLEDVPDSGAGSLLAISKDSKGRVAGTRPATITGTAQQINVANGNASAGLPTISLADLPDSGIGTALVRITRDVKGRVSGTQAATTDNLTEGTTNLYFTIGRAAAASPVQSVNGKSGVVVLAPGDIGAATAVQGAKADSAVQSVVAGTGISVNSTDPRNPIISATGGGSGVSSVFGRTGAVIAQSGDYSAAQVGADPAGTAAGLVAGKYDKTGGPISGPVSVAGDVTATGFVAQGSTAGFLIYDRTVPTTAYAYFSIGGTFTIYSNVLGGIQIVDTAGNTCPGASNVYQLGSASARWKEIFAVNGTINTSDEREKTPVRELDQAELDAAIELADEIGAFKWISAVSEKGVAARWHIGMTVQRAIQIMQSHGLDPFAYGMICHDAWDAKEAVETLIGEDGVVVAPPMPAGDLYSFRPAELQMFILAGMAERQRRIEQRLFALEQGE